MRTIGVTILLLTASVASGDDWPAYRHDNARSASSAEKLATAQLRPVWIHRTSQPPRKALYGPAQADAYREIPLLGDDTKFDSVFHPIIVGDSLYYGSSAEDAVHCLDTATGAERWSFTTGGPVRLPPSFHEGRLYFGADDGYAYCIMADDGRLVWRFSPTEGRELVFHDGRLISRWPVRSGVSVESGTAYFAASLLPANESYLCAVDALTGKPEGKRRGVLQTPAGRTYMGMMALSEKLLVAPQGRNPASIFQIPGYAYRQSAGTGCFVMLSGSHLAQGAGTGVPTTHDTNLDNPSVPGRAHVGRSEACYSGDTALLLAENLLTAFQRKGWKPLWNVRQPCRTGIAVGGTLFVGAVDEVRAHDITTGRQQWRARVWGHVDGLAAANGALYASTTDGLIYCFRAQGEAAADPYAEPEGTPVAAAPTRKRPGPVKLAAGPIIRFVDPSVALVRWETEKPSPSILEIGDEGRAYHDDRPKLVHEARIDRLRPMTNVRLQVRTLCDGQPGIAESMMLETFYNYTLPSLDGVANPYPQDKLTDQCARVAEKVVSEKPSGSGICLVVGCGNGRLAWEIARRTNLCVIGLDTDEANVAAARKTLQKTGRYGVRLSVQQVRSYDELESVPSGCANLVVSQALLEPGRSDWIGRADEICRILRPLGGVAVLGRPPGDGRTENKLVGVVTAWLQSANLPKEVSTADGLWCVIRRSAALPSSGAWTHQYGSPANAAFADEALQGARTTSDLAVQWLGRPGPRHHADRMVRGASPLVSNGRLFCQGAGRLTALDIFNGVVLWSLGLPGLDRYNMPRDGGNYCADEDFIYLVHQRKCLKIDARTGKIVQGFDYVDMSGRVVDPTWSHVAVTGGLLIGSTAREVSHYREKWGSDSWYDHRIGPKTGKIGSICLFALDKESGKSKWSYAKGLILNSSITVGDGRIYFVEVRDEEMLESTLAENWGRVYGAVPNTWHVALDVPTGKVVWERPFAGDCGMTAFYQALANGTLVTVGCSQPYKVFAFSAANGNKLWSTDVKLDGEGHGGATQRPIIVDGKVILCTTALELKTGKRLQDCPRGNCGTACASKFALFYRSGDLNMWPVDGDQPPTSITQVRPDCWLSMVPGSGMFLAPEGAGGCICGGGLRVSMGLMPRTDRPQFRLAPNRFLDTLDVQIDPPLGGEVYFTTDGSNPTKKSAKYRLPIKLMQTTVVRARATAKSPESALGNCVERRYEKIQPQRRATEGKVNFQPLDGGPQPAGFSIDSGEPVALHNDGSAYGWTEPYYAMSRRKSGSAPEIDTVVQMRGAVEWQAAVENGRYEVRLGVLAQKAADAMLRVNNVDFGLQQGGQEQEWDAVTITRNVDVRDGILRLRAASPDPSARNLQLTHLEFRKM